MCGITGTACLEPGNIDNTLLHRMCATLRHRGPDEDGFFTDDHAGLAMRRLSIVDLAGGQQPIANEVQSQWVVFNGEIYNHRVIRDTLKRLGHIFKTQSDTEAIVHAYEAYGTDCVTHFNGMFAIALWDKPKRRLFLARDRLGIKPLYYWTNGKKLVFGSEIKAILADPDVPRRLNATAVDQFLTLEYIPAPLTIFEGIYKLPPGHWLTFDESGIHIESYWQVAFDAPTIISANEAAEELVALLQDAVKIRLMADVPLGAFLSGGIDSSAVVGMMSAVMSEPVKTFSIGFGDPTYNELPYARMAAERFGTEHMEAYLEPDIADMVQKLVSHIDEPFGDFSIVPTYLVSQLAQQHVKVALSGDGGDELFAGYDTYVAQAYARRYDRLPTVVRQRFLPAMLAQFKPRAAKKGVVNKAKRFVEGAALASELQHTRWMMFMTAADRQALYTPDFAKLVTHPTAEELISAEFSSYTHLPPLIQQQIVDVRTYLVDDILTKVDRMSMATSLEVRVPFLDHRVVEFALNLPPEMKLHHGQTKWILRRALADRIPEPILNKPKEGFSIPIKHWLGTTLKPLMLELLSAETVTRRGYFNANLVQLWIDEHLTGRVNHSHRLWSLMVLELWHRTYLD
jgi:asparagine synthase (glutamine-hydrolysing)